MMKQTLKRIIIADDHAIVRTGLKLILRETPDLAITDEAGTGQELLDKIAVKDYDLVVLDISMPGKDTMDVLKELKTHFPHLPVVIFTMNTDEMYALRMIRNGAAAYMNKETNPQQIIEVLRTVINGKKYFFPHQTEMLAEVFMNPGNANVPLHESLTDREFQIFFMMASGLKKTDIVEKLMISKHTFNNHRNKILKKMKMSMNSELTRYALKQGIIQ